MFVGYKGVTVWPSGPEQAPRPEVTPGGSQRAYPVFGQKRFGGHPVFLLLIFLQFVGSLIFPFRNISEFFPRGLVGAMCCEVYNLLWLSKQSALGGCQQ